MLLNACYVTQIGNSFDENGKLIIRAQSSTFVVGGKTNNTIKGQPEKVIQIQNAPKRAPDSTALMKTCIDQSALYRLSGGSNLIIVMTLYF